MDNLVPKEVALKEFLAEDWGIERATATVTASWAVGQMRRAFRLGWQGAENHPREGDANAVPVPTPEEVVHHLIGVWLDANNIGLLGKPCADLERRIAAALTAERGRGGEG